MNANAGAPGDTPADTPFWNFSLQFYRQPGVSDSCIALQDGCGVDVNMLLYLFWCASLGRQLFAVDVKQLDERVRGWRELAVIPLRDARRKLKGAATFVSPPRQEAFRTKIKAVELEAERLQQEALYEAAQKDLPGVNAEPSAAVRANSAAYAAALGTTFPDTALAALFAAFDALPSRDRGTA